MKLFDIITIGAATQDVFLVSRDFKVIKSPEFDSGYGECFSFGSKVELKDIFFATGGGATNAAATFGNLGLAVAAHTRVGNDVQGKAILADLKAHKVAQNLVITDKKEKTAYSTILLTAGGDRTILVYRGACKQFKSAEFKSGAKTKWVYLTSVAGNIDMLMKVFEFAKKQKAFVAWNPGSAELSMDKELLRRFAAQAKVMIVNKEEAYKLVGEADLSWEATVRKVQALNKLGHAIVTDGRNGAMLATDSTIIHVGSIGSPVVNATGAGDAFGSGFVAGLILNGNPEYALKLGALNADGVVRDMGAKTGLLKKKPTKGQLDKVAVRYLS